MKLIGGLVVRVAVPIPAQNDLQADPQNYSSGVQKVKTIAGRGGSRGGASGAPAVPLGVRGQNQVAHVTTSS